MKRSMIGGLGLMLAYAMAGAHSTTSGRMVDTEKLKRKPEPPIPAGCQRYKFGEFTCIASSSKVAKKKFKKYLSNQS